MSSVSLNPANGNMGANSSSVNDSLNQPTGLDALLAQPTFSFNGAVGIEGLPGGEVMVSIQDIGADVHGGAPWLLGQNRWVPDRWENIYYGRTILADGTAYEVKNGIYIFYDKNGNVTGKFKEVLQKDATRTLQSTSTSEAKGGIPGVGEYKSGSSTTSTIYLAPVK